MTQYSRQTVVADTSEMRPSSPDSVLPPSYSIESCTDDPRLDRHIPNTKAHQIKADTHDTNPPKKTVRGAKVIWTSRRPGCTSKPTNA